MKIGGKVELKRVGGIFVLFVAGTLVAGFVKDAIHPITARATAPAPAPATHPTTVQLCDGVYLRVYAHLMSKWNTDDESSAVRLERQLLANTDKRLASRGYGQMSGQSHAYASQWIANNHGRLDDADLALAQSNKPNMTNEEASAAMLKIASGVARTAESECRA